jgi:uncharacterized OB-fold protein
MLREPSHARCWKIAADGPGSGIPFLTYRCEDCGERYVSEPPMRCEHCGSSIFKLVMNEDFWRPGEGLRALATE